MTSNIPRTYRVTQSKQHSTILVLKTDCPALSTWQSVITHESRQYKFANIAPVPPEHFPFYLGAAEYVLTKSKRD